MCDWNPKTKNNGWEFHRNQVGWGWWWKVTRIPPNPPRIQVFRNYNCNLRCICRIFLFLPDLWPKLPKKFGSQTTSNPFQILRFSKRNLTILPKNQVLRTLRYRIPPKKCVNHILQQQKLANKLRITAQPDERITSIGSIGSGMFVILASWTEGVTSLLKETCLGVIFVLIFLTHFWVVKVHLGHGPPWKCFFWMFMNFLLMVQVVEIRCVFEGGSRS